MQATIAASPSPPGVDPGLRERLIDGLNRNLANLTDLWAGYKQAHWNVVGRDFAQLHALFDELADQTRTHMDEIAERAVALGGVAHGTLQAAANHSTLPPFPLDERDEVRLVEELVRRIDVAVGDLRREMHASAEELATQDVYMEAVRGFEKQRWMLWAHLAGGGT